MFQKIKSLFQSATPKTGQQKFGAWVGCVDCNHQYSISGQDISIDVCPKCGSKNNLAVVGCVKPDWWGKDITTGSWD